MKWSETTVVNSALARVHAAVADENELLQWSAWPAATGYSCRIDGDGCSVGSTIVFVDRRGVVQGRQVLHAVGADVVEYRLRNRGPGGREMTPNVTFTFEDLDGAQTRVRLDFAATAPLPPVVRQLVETAMSRRVRRLHVKDLEQLKQHVESR
jgi:hypothetical protein